MATDPNECPQIYQSVTLDASGYKCSIIAEISLAIVTAYIVGGGVLPKPGRVGTT